MNLQWAHLEYSRNHIQLLYPTQQILLTSSSVVDWLECWSRSDRKGKLSAQTFTSFKHSCLALPKIVNYLTEHRQFKYVLSSRLQNDPLEHHFGLYRMMSGEQYHVIYCQIRVNEE